MQFTCTIYYLPTCTRRRCAAFVIPSSYPTIIFRISFVKVMIMPPARVRNPFTLCDGSWLLRDRPTCTMPNPSRIMPIALIRLNIKVDRLLTTEIGSPVANAIDAIRRYFLTAVESGCLKTDSRHDEKNPLKIPLTMLLYAVHRMFTAVAEKPAIVPVSPCNQRNLLGFQGKEKTGTILLDSAKNGVLYFLVLVME